MKKVLITGVSGYLGQCLVRDFSKRKGISEITGIDIKRPAVSPPGFTFVEMDIRDRRMAEVLRKHSPDTVFHLAFVVQPIHSIRKMHDIDIAGTRNMLEASLGARVKNFIVTTSTLGYGALKDNPPSLAEGDPLRAKKSYPYGYFKAQCDMMIREFAKKHPEMPVTILRPCTVFGPNIDNYVSRAVFKPVVMSVAGYDPVFQLLHEDDFVQACRLALDKRAPGVFNITGDGTILAGDIFRMYGSKKIPVPSFILYPLLELLWRLHLPGIEVNRGYLDYTRYTFVADNSKAKEGLGFKPRYSTLETLKETIRSRK